MQLGLLLGVLQKLGPEPLPDPVTFGEVLAGFTCRASFRARSDDDREQRSGGRVSNADSFDLDEVERRRGCLIQPRDRFDVFGSGSGDNPDGGLRFQRCQVRDDLAEVVVVGALQLVLDDDGVAILVLTHKVDAEVAC